MTNQANEDELRDELYDLAFLTGADSETGERTLAFIASELAEYVQDLIRTEKLKLLNEVIHQSTVNLKSAKAVAGWAELRKELLEGSR